MRTTKLSANKSLMLLLAIALLAMQWTTTHIHLAKHHAHEGSHHQHQIDAHAHDLIDLHASVIDPSHHVSHADIIEISYDYSLPKTENHENPPAVAVISILQSLPHSLPISTKITIILNTKLSHLDRTTASPRAPPITS